MGKDMKYAIVENGVVANLAVSETALASGWIASNTAKIGWLYDGETFTPPEKYVPTAKEQSAIVRLRRTGLLVSTDWLAGSDLIMSDEMKTYRQALRDITDHPSFPFLAENDWPV